MNPSPVLPDEFLITPYQERILLALEGRALHTEELVREVGDPQQFFAGRGGIWELRHRGLVVHDGRTGNYRPDVPPSLSAGQVYLRQDRSRPGLGVQGRHYFPAHREQD